MKAPLKKRILLCTSLLLPLFLFQNCAGPLDIDDTEISPLASSVSHAFEFQADTIAYMSCDAGNTTDNSLFTFKVGAYNQGSGVKLTDSYIESLGNSRDSDRIDALVNSPANQDALLQLSVRNPTNLTQTYGLGGFNEGTDFDNFFYNLTTQNIVEELYSLERDDRLNYFNQGVAGVPGIAPEGIIRFNSSYNAARDLREQLGGGLQLILGYGDELIPENNTFIKGLDDGSPRGRSFNINFGIGRGMTITPGSNQASFTSTFRGEATKVLSFVTEQDLETNQTISGNWDCPERLRFVIARPSSEGDTNISCGINPLDINKGFIQDSASSPTSHPTNPFQNYFSQEEYQAVRAVLPANQWTVDLGRRCVVPKDPESADRCYGEGGFDPNVNPDGNINYYATDDSGRCGSGSTNTAGCPHYVSICVRR